MDELIDIEMQAGERLEYIVASGTIIMFKGV